MSTFRELLKKLVNVQIVLQGVEYPNTYADDLSIDRTNLDEEFVHHSERYAYYATLAELSDDTADRLKEDLEHLGAKLDHDVRQKAKAIQAQDEKFKMTETMVKNEVAMHPAYRAKQEEYQDARHLAKVLKNAPHAFAHRRDMLIELGKTNHQMTNDPRVTRGLQETIKNRLHQSRAPQLPPMDPIDDAVPVEQLPLTGTRCSVCQEPQHVANGGWVCTNGHGGADPMTEASSPSAMMIQPTPDQAAPRRRPARSAG